jgi:diacylglycerol kinase family enzyme
LAAYIVVDQFPQNLVFAGLILFALSSAWFGLLRRGAQRMLGLVISLTALVAALAVLLATGDHGLQAFLLAIGVTGALALARAAFASKAILPSAPVPRHPVLLLNPKSGGGKAERFSLEAEARARGIEPIRLEPGADLEELVRDAARNGADAVAMAGGDGSQAVVAAVAAELGLPYTCVPAGTRNHFALDLGVDRNDVVGALDAFVNGGERRVDLAEVNGRIFVNNVSLGLYAEAVQRPGYRGAKLRTLLETVPDVLGPDAAGLELAWQGPDGDEQHSGVAILVSNNRYRLGPAMASGTRPSIDDGLLGIAVASAPAEDAAVPGAELRLREWSTPEFEIHSPRPVPAGVDGEAVTLDPPLRFRIRRRALRVRISKAHPGISPSAAIPAGPWSGTKALAAIAAGRFQQIGE